MPSPDQELREELDWARRLAADGLPAEALIVLRKIARREPQLAEAHCLIAALLHHQEAHDEALEAAERCLRLDPDNERAKKIRDSCQEALTRKKRETPAVSLRAGSFVYQAGKTKVRMRRCPSCGKEIIRGARLCRHCGATIGMPPWVRRISVWVIGALLIGGVLYLPTLLIGRRGLNSVLVSGDGAILESISASGEEVAIRVDRLKWSPGSIFPAPIPADSGGQIWNMSHGASCTGRITNASSEPLASIVIYAHFSGKTGTPFGAAEAEVTRVPPGGSKEFSMVTRLGSYAHNCQISIGEVRFGPLDEEPVRVAEAPQPKKSEGYPWGQLVLMCIVSSVLLFVAARLQLACDPKIPWDHDLRPDAIASVLAVPFIVLSNVWLFYLLRGIGLGPMGVIAVAGPFVLLFLVFAYVFKRGFVGVFLIWLFYGFLYLAVLKFIGAA